MYPRPRVLGVLPIGQMDDFQEQIPQRWRKHRGVTLPMFHSEAGGMKALKLQCSNLSVNLKKSNAWHASLKRITEIYDQMVHRSRPVAGSTWELESMMTPSEMVSSIRQDRRHTKP